MKELAKTYDHAAVQKSVSAMWDTRRTWHTEPDPTKPAYSIVIPPPNVTAPLHLGHALNNTIQDILVRWRRMCGDNAVWIPGTDHAGIATQTVVDKRLTAQGEKALKDYKKLEAEGGNGREQFLAKVQAWKDEYEQVIIGQLKAMGCSCDWDRTAFTMDEARSAAVREAFFQLFKAGLIYRGKRLVNWDPVTQTALADDEVENEEVDGFFYYLKYPVCDAQGNLEKAHGASTVGVTVATTRPETMLGDTAVAVNPKDPRAASLIGKFVKLPIVDRIIPIIQDDYVVLPIEHGGDPADAKAKFSSGFLKVTPAHDPNDYALGTKYNLQQINVMAPDASISLDHGWSALEPEQASNATLKPFVGLSREQAREQIVAWFKAQGLLEKVIPYRHSVGHSYRSHAAIEPYLSDQWYCRVTDDRLAKRANEVLAKDDSQEGLKFYPDRYAKTYETWHNNIRDWCISRQLWWGHRIPVWTVTLDRPVTDEWIKAFESELVATLGLEPAVSRGSSDNTAYVCFEYEDQDEYLKTLSQRTEKAFEGIVSATQDTDVLDTWFSSGLWPLSTLGWPTAKTARHRAKYPKLAPEERDQFNRLADTFEQWNPTSVLCTAREIITLWVSRMVMFNEFFEQRLPFKDVFIHAMIQDGHGQKMSKSLGNGVDPLDIIATHGTDAMRFTLCQMTTHTQDVRLPVDAIDPFTSEAFTPTFVTNPAGYSVAAPVQERGGKKFASSYGAISGQADASLPVARNTSSKFDLGRNFASKLWNASKFVLMQSQGATAAEASNSVADRWILSRLARTLDACDAALKEYRFDQYARACYDFVWRDYCDWYIEAAKPAMRDPATKPATANLLASVLDVVLRMLQPITPFVTQELWEALEETAPARGLPGLSATTKDEAIMLASYPQPTAETKAYIDDAVEAEFDRLQQIITAVRTLRAEQKVDAKKKLTLHIHASGSIAEEITRSKALVELFTVCTIEAIGPDVIEPSGCAKTTAAGTSLYIIGAVDPATSEKRKADLIKSIAAMKGRLSNEAYVAKAPEALVNQTKQQLADAEAELAKLNA